MKKIQKKTVLKPRNDKNSQAQEEKQITTKIIINNPIITKDNKKVFNYTENQIQKRYSRQSENQKQKNKSEEYLGSDLEDSDNRKIYDNVILRMKNKEIFQNPESNRSRKKDNYIDLHEPINITNKNKIINTNIKNNNNNQRKHVFNPNTINTEKQNNRYTNKINNKNYNKISGDKINIKDNSNNNDKKNSTSIYIDRRNLHKDNTKKEDNKGPGTCKLRRQTVDRGGKYNNIQCTHIIYSKKNLDFHIVNPLEIEYDLKPKLSAGVGYTNHSRKDSTGNFKISCKSSVDGINITPKIKKPNEGKTTVFYHCSEIRQKKDTDKKNISDNKGGIKQNRNATNNSGIPRSGQYNKVTNYKTEKKYQYTKPFLNVNSTDKKNNNINNDNYKQSISHTINYNNTSYNNYKKDNINHSQSGTVLQYNTPIKTFNNNYSNSKSNINIKNTNTNNRYSNYNQNNNQINNKNVKDQNKNQKNSNIKNLVSPRNLNKTEKKLAPNQIKENTNKNHQIKKDVKKYNEKRNTSIEITLEENKKPVNAKTVIKTTDNNKFLNNKKISPKYEIKKKNDEKIKVKIDKDFEKRFLLRNYFKIFKNNTLNDKNETEYEKWFKRNCNNNNDVSKKTIANKYLYFIPNINKNRDEVEQMPYDEWFNRNCEKSENVLKKQNKENENKLLINKLQNILDTNDKNNDYLNNEFKKLNINEPKEILKNLRNSTNNITHKKKLDFLLDKFDEKQKEDEKIKLIKSAKDKETKEIIKNLINLWENENTLPNKEKENKFEKLNELFRENKKNDVIDELTNLDKNDKKEAIDYLKLKNKFKKNEIDEINNLSDKRKKIDVLVSILGGKSENKNNKKEKLKKIVDILLNLDKKTKNDCVDYMKNTAQEDEQKNDELLSIINELPSEEKEEYEKFDLDKNNYSYSYSTSFEKYFETTSRHNTEEVKENKDIIDKDKNNEDEIDDFKLLDDDIIDIVNEIQNKEELPKKKLDEEEFKDVAGNIIFNLYENKNIDDDDFTENDEEIKTIINSLNNMNKEDRIKTVDLLKQNADDDSKKKKLSILKNKIKSISQAKKFINSIIVKNEEEEKKLDELTNEFILDELESQNTIYLDNTNNRISVADNSTNNNLNNSEEEEKRDKLTNLLKSMELYDKNVIYEKLRNSTKNPEKSSKLLQLFKTTKFINKIKNLRKTKLIKKEEESKENIEENKLKKIIKDFVNDLYEVKEKPLTRKEIRENEDENNEKLKEISKVIQTMNKNDQNIIMDKLKLKANDEFKKSQFNRLNKLINSINNVKKFIKKLRQKNVDISNIINIDQNKKELSKNELKELTNNLTNILLEDIMFKSSDNAENKEETLLKVANTITHLNQIQQNDILNSIKSKIDSKEKEEQYKKLIEKVDYLNKMKKIEQSLSMDKSNLKENIINEEVINKKLKNEKEAKIELSDKDLINLTEAILKHIFNKSQKKINNNNICLTKAEEYLFKKEQEKKFEKTVGVLNKLNKKDKEKISGILAYILDNEDEIKQLNILNNKIGIYNDNENKENLVKIIEDYKKDDSTEELKENKLAEYTEELIRDLLKDYSLEDKNKKLDKLNKAANTIILMNKKDQEKILDTLNNFAKTENQKETMEKLNRLVENLNYMNFYLFNVNRQHMITNSNNSKNIKNADFKNLKNSIMTQIFKDDEDFDFNENIKTSKNMNAIALKLSTLDKNNQKEILSEINKRSNENENKNAIKSIDELNENLKIIKMTNILSSVFDKKQKNQKKNKLEDSEIKILADNINNVLVKDKSPNNHTEQLLYNNHKQEKINQLTKSLITFDEETKKKTINYLSKSIINNNHKKVLNILKDSIMNKNKINDDKNKSILASRIYMINTLESVELNENELNLLIETFCKDLFNDEKEDVNKKEENMNLICNIIKELDENNQNKVLEKLRSRPEAKDKSDLLDDLEDNIIKLRILKDELNDEKKDKVLIDPNKSVIFNNSTEEDDDLLEKGEESEESVTVEITVDDIGQDELKELCQVFTVDYVDNKTKKKEKPSLKIENKSIRYLAKSLVRFDNKAQKKITDKLEENCKNKNEKEQFNLLKERIEQLNTYKKLGDEVKQKKKEEIKKNEEKMKRIEELNDNSNKNLDKEKLDIIENEIINDLYNKENIEFDKNEDIKNYLSEAYKEEKINNVGDKINKLSIEDKKTILNKLEDLANDEEKKDIFNKLCKLINNLEKIKQLNDKMKIKEKEIDSKDNNSINSDINLSADILKNMKNEMEKEFFDESEENFINNNLSDDIADKIMKLDENNQNLILKELKEKAENTGKQNRFRKLTNVLDKFKALKKFSQKVKKKHLIKLALEKLENEKKYGIVILKNGQKEENPTLLMKKPEELNEDKLSELTNFIIEDLKKINDEENDNIDIPYLDKYLKEKENEKIFEKMIDVLNSLDVNDKAKIVEEIKNNFDSPKINNLYNRFMKILSKKERQFDKEKRKVKKDAINEIENEKNNDDSLLYSIIKDINDKSTIDVETIGEPNKNEKKWTHKKGRLETEEIY